MHRVKRIAFFCTTILTLIAVMETSAHPTTNPNDPVYAAIDRWAAQGYVTTRQPLFRPYPKRILDSILGEVVQRGDRWARAEAQRYISETDPGRVVPSVHAQVSADGTEFEPVGTIQLDFLTGLRPGIEIGGSVAGAAVNLQDEERNSIAPYGRRSDFDILEDNAKVTVRGRDIYTLLDINTQTTFFNEDMYLTAGIMRRSFGPFLDESPVLSASAPQSANAVFEWRGKRLFYTGGVFSFTATTPFDQPKAPGDGDNIDLNNDGIDDLRSSRDLVPGKLYFLQALTWRATDNLDVSFFEAVMMEQRIELAYLVPLKFMWHAQGTAAFADNSFLGITADYRPVPSVRVLFTLFVDDASFNDMVRLDFDTKFKLAASTGVQWAPKTRFIDQIRLGYEAVLPYMYTHSETPMYSLEPRYRNYPHQNESLGIGLPPNSDRATLTVDIRPAPAFRTSLSGAVVRHANASEDLLTTYMNDGGYFDNGRFGEFEVYDYDPDDGGDTELVWKPGELSINEDFRFLQQDAIETRWQASVELVWSPLRERNRIDLSAGYTWEYVKNPIEYSWPGTRTDGTGGVVIQGPDEIIHYSSFSATYRY
jgi:hypothetical protein